MNPKTECRHEKDAVFYKQPKQMLTLLPLFFLYLPCNPRGLLFSPSRVFASEDLSEVRKKQIVYEMYEDYKKSFPEVSDIMPEKAMLLMETNKVVFVDVRETREIQISMLPDAVRERDF